MKLFVEIAIVMVLVGLFVLLFILNQRTKVPEGCEAFLDKCETCDNKFCNRRKD